LGTNFACAFEILELHKMKLKNIPRKQRAEDVVDKQCRRALALMDARNYADALKRLESLLDKAPEHYLARLNRSVCLSQLGRYDEAARQLYLVHVSVPNDLRVLKMCGVAHAKAGYFDMALRFLQRYTKEKPSDYDAWGAMCTCAGGLGQHTNAVIYATQALGLDPLNPDAYNNLGVTLLGLARLDEAEQAFQTALAIDAENITASSNLGAVFEKRGDFKGAVISYDGVLPRIDQNSSFGKEFLYRSSYAYLGAGLLSEGWRRYDYGFFPHDSLSRQPKRKFEVPQWGGERLAEDRLLVWGEQGLGDELWFLGILNEVRELCNKVTVECQPRLVSLLQRSFPDVSVRASNLSPSASCDYDFHIPAGSLMGIFRNHINNFKKFKPYLKPQPARSKDFLEKLKPYAEKKLIGVCWRSGKLSAERNQYFLSLDELSEVLTNPNYAIVNLQYGDCEEELLRVEEALGIEIIRWQDLDLKDDQEGVAALISQLDLVLSAPTAVAQLAIAMGSPLVQFGMRHWSFLGQERYPWSSNMTWITPEAGKPLNTALPTIVEAVSNPDKFFDKI